MARVRSSEEIREHSLLDRAIAVADGLTGHGVVVLTDTEAQRKQIWKAAKEWAESRGLPLRRPPAGTNVAGLSSELGRAIGGVLLLDDFGGHDPAALEEVLDRIVAENLDVVVFGVDTREAYDQTYKGDLDYRASGRRPKADELLETIEDLADPLPVVTWREISTKPASKSALRRENATARRLKNAF
jgi:hypothetical protein